MAILHLIFLKDHHTVFFQIRREFLSFLCHLLTKEVTWELPADQARIERFDLIIKVDVSKPLTVKV